MGHLRCKDRVGDVVALSPGLLLARDPKALMDHRRLTVLLRQDTKAAGGIPKAANGRRNSNGEAAPRLSGRGVVPVCTKALAMGAQQCMVAPIHRLGVGPADPDLHRK